MDTSIKLNNVIRLKTCKLTPFKGATESKTVTLEIEYDGLTIEDILAKAVKGDVIDWQNGSGGRKNYDKLVDKSTIKIKASTPGSMPLIDPIISIIQAASAAKMSIEDYLKAEVAKRQTVVLRKAE